MGRDNFPAQLVNSQSTGHKPNSVHPLVTARLLTNGWPFLWEACRQAPLAIYPEARFRFRKQSGPLWGLLI